MLFNKELISSKKNELEINDELTEKDFLEINKEISKALFQMKREKDPKEEASDNDDDNEKGLNYFNMDFFSSNNSSTVSIDNFSDNSEKSFKNIDIELDNNNSNFENNIKNIKNIFYIRNLNQNNCIKNFNNDFNCKYNNIININNANISTFPLNKNIYEYNFNYKIEEFNKLNNYNLFNSSKSKQNMNNEIMLNINNIESNNNANNMEGNSNDKVNKNIIQVNINKLNLSSFNKSINNNIKIINQNDFNDNKNINNIINNTFNNNKTNNFYLNSNNNFLNNTFIINNNSNINKISNQNQNINSILFNNKSLNDKEFKNNASLSQFSEDNNSKNIKDSPKNIINLKNIIKGKDKRTTLIIRNIPNKYSISLLLNELREKFNYKFDVLFLPQDYFNNSNLGYGFINFINYKYIIHFYDEYQGKKWPSFKSKKKCQLEYSKYQGKSEIIKYIHKKLSLTCHFNNDENLKKSFFIKNEECCNKPLVEIPIKYYKTFKSYNPNVLYQLQNDKLFIKEIL